MSVFNNTLSDNTVSNTLAEAASTIKDKLDSAVHSAEQTVDDVCPEIHSWFKKADKTLQDGVDSLLKIGEREQLAANHYAHAMLAYLGKTPKQSTLAIAAVGAIFAAVVFNARRKDHTLAKTSSMVKDKLKDAAHSVEDAVEGAYPDIQDYAKKLNKTLHDGVDSLFNAGEKVQASTNHYAHSVESYVEEKPVQSVLAVAVTGAVLALLIFTSRRK